MKMLTTQLSLLFLLLLIASVASGDPLLQQPMLPQKALDIVRSNTPSDVFVAAMARLRRLQLPKSSSLNTQTEAQIADKLGRAAAGACGAGRRLAIANGGLWPDDQQHNAVVPECMGPAPPMLFLMVISKATPEGAARRADVRRTWGSRRGVALAFFLGRPKSSDVQAAVDAEAGRYRDLVQFRMLDIPEWGTVRHLASLEWALVQCPGARHLVHVEDSVFVDVSHLTAYLSVNPPEGFLCTARRNEVPIRSRKSDWYLSERDFPGKRYPDFCNTAAYALSNETASRLLYCAAVMPNIWMDDVHVTGILRVAANIPLVEFPRGHGHGPLLPSDSRNAWGSVADYMFLSSERPEFVGAYWSGVWRTLLLREGHYMIY